MTKPQRNENADVLSILSSLIEFRTYSQQPNHQITNWIEAYLKKYGIVCSVIFGLEGDRANLFAKIGPKEASGYILSSNIDVAPVDIHSRRPLGAMEWQRHSWKTASGKKLG